MARADERLGRGPGGPDDPGGDPLNPLKARWLGFLDGQGIHGTDDVASLGTAASHGCIRMAVGDVEQLYTQVPKGTPLFLQSGTAKRSPPACVGDEGP